MSEGRPRLHAAPAAAAAAAQVRNLEGGAAATRCWASPRELRRRPHLAHCHAGAAPRTAPPPARRPLPPPSAAPLQAARRAGWKGGGAGRRARPLRAERGAVAKVGSLPAQPVRWDGDASFSVFVPPANAATPTLQLWSQACRAPLATPPPLLLPAQPPKLTARERRRVRVGRRLWPVSAGLAAG
jgi:hypothetical protein